MSRPSLCTAAVLVVGMLAGCAQSDKELCEDARKKLVECGSNSFECPENLADSVREQYECIVDTPCNEIATECTN